MVSDTEPTLEVRNLRTHFFTKAGVVKAVDDVSFAVRPGKVMGLVGESGSGKTVTGFSILGLVDAPGRVVGGEIRYKGENIATATDDRMRRLRGRGRRSPGGKHRRGRTPPGTTPPRRAAVRISG